MFDIREHMKNEKAFDDLLKDSFLELDFDQPENNRMIQALSDSVMCSKNFQVTKSLRNLKNLWSKINLQSVIWMVVVLVITTVSIYLFSGKKQKQNDLKVPLVKEERVLVTKNIPSPLFKEKKKKNQAIYPLQVHKKQKTLVVKMNADITKVNIPNNEKLQEHLVKTPVLKMDRFTLPSRTFEQPYVFPTLTDKEIRANEKQKRKMSDQLMKLSKNQYPFIPRGSISYKGDTKMSGGFYMQNHEVTNLEYRTFLFDLLIQNRKDEFLKAKPIQTQWINSNNTNLFDHLKDVYFSDKFYNEYPVVNITAKAAMLYCNWLNELLMTREDGKLHYEIKLPTDIEWMYAAKGGLQGSYPWGTDSIQNKNNAFLANFNVQLLKEEFKQPLKYTTKFGNPWKLSYTACTSAGLVLNKDTVATVSVGEYNPNWYGLYCMSGNVAEWTISDDSPYIKALGGSWGSDFEHLKITNESEYDGKGSSPFIGFRFIIITINE